MHAAWNAVSATSIVNCFRKANFYMASEPEQSMGATSQQPDEDDDIDNIPLAMLSDDE